MVTRFFIGLFVLCIMLFSCENGSKVKSVDISVGGVNVEEEILLGQLLFHERRLSKDNTVSCAHCHIEHLAFTDGLAVSEGVEGRKAARNSPTLFNMKDQPFFMFDGVITSLEVQALSPITDHNEMASSMKEIIQKLKDDKVFKRQCEKAYGRELDAEAVTKSLAAYQNTLVSINSKYDLYLKDEKKYPLSENALKGKELFFGKFNCVACHKEPHFTNYESRNNGISFSAADPGRYRATGKEDDRGAFKVPTLRNIAITGPYMHDGRYKSLQEVLAFYAGKKENGADEIVRNYNMSQEEQKFLIYFLESLTDTMFTK